MSDFTIRPARIEDCATIQKFIKDLAIYEREPDAAKATLAQLEAALFCEHPKVFGLICETETEAIGMAVYFYNFSTWLGRLGLFLEDLYVDPAHRGKGAGKALLKTLAKTAVDQGCGRFEWNVLDWNQPAIDFYESFGAKPQSEWVGYRLTGDALEAFATSEN